MLVLDFSANFSIFSAVQTQDRKQKLNAKIQAGETEMSRKHPRPMDRRYAPAPLRLFKTRDTRLLNTLANCGNEDCKHDLSKFEFPPPNCPRCGRKTSTAPPLPPPGPGWGVDYRSSGGVITDGYQKPEVEEKAYGYGHGAQRDRDIFCGDGRLATRMDEWTRKEWEDRGTKSMIEKWREVCGAADCRGYLDNGEGIQHVRSSWDCQEKLRGTRPRSRDFSIGRSLSRPERQ